MAGCSLFGGGKPLDYTWWRRKVGFQDLRRANATEMVRAKVDVKTAQARLGHSDPRLTLAI
jgi:integrase